MNLNAFPAWFEQLRKGGRVNTPAEAYMVSPLLYRATNLRADAVSSVPFRVYQGETEQEWPFTQTPAQLFKEIERSLCLTGGAYLYKIYKGRRLTGFVPLNPTTMSVSLMTDKATLENPLLGASFVQSINGKAYGPWTISDVVYFREPSYYDDIGPGVGAAHVALNSAKLEHYLSRFASAFFEGGAQPVTIMNLPEAMDESEFQRFRTEMRSSASGGLINAFKMIFMRSPDIKIEQLTPPINTLQMPELYERVITSVGMAFGVPRTMLEASAANYATADSDRQSFWRETIIPRLSLYEAVLNEQIFAPLGWYFEFQPEALDVMQTDEAARAGSLLQLVQAGVPLRGAMMMLGYDLVDEVLGTMIDVTPTPTPPAPLPTPDEAPPTDDGVNDEVQAKRRAEWALLAKKIERRIKAQKDPSCSFESDVISAEEVKSVMSRLYAGISVHDMHHVIDEVKAVDDLLPQEKSFYDRIVKEMEKRGATWARQIVQGKDVDPSLRDVIAPAMQSELTKYIERRFGELGAEFVPMDEATATNRINDWLADYVPIQTRLIDETSAQRIQQVITTYRNTPGMTIQDVADMLRPIADPSRAAMIAVTEMTRASTQAVNQYKEYLAENGVVTTTYWSTQNDNIVEDCPICSPMDRVPQDEWPADLADGPPAHPRCRCTTFITIRKVER